METNNIISDFLDINKDISMIDENSKIKIFSRIKKKYYRSKLIKKVEKLHKANIPLNKNNILELINYIYTNYMPDGKFDCIKSIIYYENSGYYSCNISLEDCSYNIKLSNYISDKKFTISIFTNTKRENKGYTVELSDLHSDNKEINSYLNILNSALINTMIIYILNILESYEGSDNEI